MDPIVMRWKIFSGFSGCFSSHHRATMKKIFCRFPSIYSPSHRATLILIVGMMVALSYYIIALFAAFSTFLASESCNFTFPGYYTRNQAIFKSKLEINKFY
ncbi:unnamed protein product [Trifolium pratense]|uniref:Uncharacterized protein n=1 Tax=Trifolium pratense TaxID=57577 RepID=A0ACB0KF19_TRIPR|nr:unnamed protein product [Trifolium pratense]